MTHGSLFSGIGGFDLAAEWMGWENIFQVEIDSFCQKVLAKNFPTVKRYGDIKQFDGKQFRGAVDVLSGGFPCQPYSTAGKRKGKEDDRHLWPEMLRAIREIQPTWVVGENVRGLTNWNGGLVFDEVQADLETEGYQVTPFLLPACGVGAPHRRDRIWFIAYSQSNNDKRKPRAICSTDERQAEERQEKRISKSAVTGDEVTTNSSASSQREYRETGCPESEDNSEGNKREWLWSLTERTSEERDVTNTDCNQRPERWMHTTERETSERYIGSLNAWITRRGWENFPTQPPLCGGDDGLPRKLDGITFPKWRNESLKGLGNAIVPQVAFEIFKAIETYDKEILQNKHSLP